MHCRSGRIAAVFLAAALLGAGAAQADYKAGRAAWEAGRHGEAVRQWEAAAKANDVRALLALGRAFAKGVGVPRDFIEAHKWLNLAAGRGSAEAAAERDALEARMTMEEQAEARKLARAWRMAATAPKLQPKPVPPARKAEQPKTPAPAAPPPKHVLREAQTLLARLGYRPGPADGDWRPESAQAYRTFLGRAGMKPRDTLTPAGLRALRRAAKQRATAAQSAGKDLHRAVRDGDIDGLKAALRAGGDANARDRRGWTALMHSANKGHTLMVAPLLAAKADPNVRAADGATALFMATAHGHTEIVEFLMKGGADISIKGPKGRTAVDVARLRYGNAAAARRKGADIAVLALLSGKKWVEVAASPEAMEAVLALTLRERKTIQFGLKAAGSDPGPADGVFGPATRKAVKAWQKKKRRAATGHLTIAAATELTVAGERAARTRAAQRKATHETLRVCSASWLKYEFWKRADSEQVKRCLAAGANVNARNEYGHTPLHAAQTAEIAKMLLAAGANIHARTTDITDQRNNRTPLHIASEMGRVDVVKVLLAAGADVRAQNKGGDTPLHFAAARGRVEAVKALLAGGSDVDIRSKLGFTPLHEAASWSQVGVVKVLLAAGADVNASYSGRVGADTPMCGVFRRLAESLDRSSAVQNYFETYTLLRNNGASARPNCKIWSWENKGKRKRAVAILHARYRTK